MAEEQEPQTPKEVSMTSDLYNGAGYSQNPGHHNRSVRPIHGLVGRIPVAALYPNCRSRRR